MGSSQNRQYGKSRGISAVLVFGTAFIFPVVCIGQNKKYSPPPQRSVPAPTVRAQRPPSVPAVTRPNPGSYPGVRPAPSNTAPIGARSPGAPSYVPGNNNSAYRPGYPAGATNGVRNPGVPSTTPGDNAFHANGAPSRGSIPARGSATTMNLRSGGTAQLRTNGQFRSIDRGGAHIAYGARGGRTVVAEHNGARVVTTGAHQGYVQHPYLNRNGHTYVQRTYVVNNVTHTVAYRSYSFRGAHYYGYAPAYYYRPAYYRWAYTPWRSPVYYSWGWTAAAYPWYGYYGAYFTPYPVYPSAAYWLTDYLVAADLQAAYAARMQPTPTQFNGDTGAAQPYDSQSAVDQQPAPLGSDVKQAISMEVAAQLAEKQRSAEQSESQRNTTVGTLQPDPDEPPPALGPGYRTFVVDSSLDVVSVDQECTLTPGDVITRVTDTPDQNQKVVAKIWSSKKSDCSAGRQITVAVEDLQEMQNHLNEQLDSGLQALANRQGTGGIPRAPDTTLIAGEVPPPVADASAAQTLGAQEVVADQAEKDAAREAGGQGAS
jgi:hypothetical protein